MLQRFVSASVLGGFVLMLWGMFSWMALPFHKTTLNSFTDEDTVGTILKEHAQKGDGVYLYPYEKGREESTKKQEAGAPYAFIVYRKNGNPSMAGPVFQGLLYNILISGLITTLVLATGCRSYRRRIIIVATITVIAGLMCNVSNMLWWQFPSSFTILELVDRLVSGILLGMVIAKFTQPTYREPATLPAT